MSAWVITDAPGRVTLWRIERRERGTIFVRRWVQRRKMLRAEESWVENEWARRRPRPAPPYMVDEAERHLAYRAIAMSEVSDSSHASGVGLSVGVHFVVTLNDAPNAKGGA